MLDKELLMYLKKSFAAVPVLLLAAIAMTAAGPAKNTGYTGKLKAAHLDANQVNFVRPGIKVKIVSAGIAKDGTITARVTIADPQGLPLDRNGVTTPGTVSLSLIAAYVPAGKTQYVSYSTTTLKATINDNPAQVQAANDSGGTFTANADGDYTYTFKTRAPANFDASATHAIGVSARRDLSAFMTYDEWSETANDVYTFVPHGPPVQPTRPS